MIMSPLDKIVAIAEELSHDLSNSGAVRVYLTTALSNLETIEIDNLYKALKIKKETDDC